DSARSRSPRGDRARADQALRRGVSGNSVSRARTLQPARPAWRIHLCCRRPIRTLAGGAPVTLRGLVDTHAHLMDPAFDRQRAALEWHLRLAEELALPAIIHNRQADIDVAEALEASAQRNTSRNTPGVLHCFSSTDPLYLQRMLDAGYFVSFAGPLTFKTAVDLRAMAGRVPLDRLLVETDCPYLAPAPHRGQRNEPAFVRDTAACLAEVVGV